jgi:16S rRNA G966 N2-methylase RsmD
MLPLLLEITDHQYTEINELFNNVPDDLFNSWLTDKCLDKSDERSYHTYDKELIKNLFVEELINEQLQIASKKMKQADFDFSQFSNSNNADVNVPEWMADKQTKPLPNSESLCDLSVGDGQLIVSFLKERTANSITICDKSLINLKTAECRIKKAQQNIKIISILYTEIDDLERKLYMKNNNTRPRFDCILTNPPFFGKGNPDHLQFLSLANEMSDQYILFVQPSTYLVDQKKENSYYQDARNIIKDHLVNVTLYTKDVFDNAQLNTGVAAIIVDKKTTVTEYDVEYNNLGKIVHYTSIEDINNFASNDMFHSIKKKVLKACKTRNLQNDL